MIIIKKKAQLVHHDKKKQKKLPKHSSIDPIFSRYPFLRKARPPYLYLDLLALLLRLLNDESNHLLYLSRLTILAHFLTLTVHSINHTRPKHKTYEICRVREKEKF